MTSPTQQLLQALPPTVNNSPQQFRLTKRTTALLNMATAQNPSATAPLAGGAVAATRASLSSLSAPSIVRTVSALSTVRLNEWQKVIKYDSQFEEAEFAIAEFASLQRYNLILIQNQLAKLKVQIALEGKPAPTPEEEPIDNLPPLDSQVKTLQDTLHHYGRQGTSS